PGLYRAAPSGSALVYRSAPAGRRRDRPAAEPAAGAAPDAVALYPPLFGSRRVMWPILRPGRALLLPERGSLAVRSSSASRHLATSLPIKLVMTASAWRSVEPSGRPQIARTNCSN